MNSLATSGGCDNYLCQCHLVNPNQSNNNLATTNQPYQYGQVQASQQVPQMQMNDPYQLPPSVIQNQSMQPPTSSFNSFSSQNDTQFIQSQMAQMQVQNAMNISNYLQMNTYPQHQIQNANLQQFTG